MNDERFIPPTWVQDALRSIGLHTGNFGWIIGVYIKEDSKGRRMLILHTSYADRNAESKALQPFYEDDIDFPQELVSSEYDVYRFILPKESGIIDNGF